MDVGVVLHSDGSVKSIYYEADPSGLWGRIFADATLFPEMSEAERAEAIAALGDDGGHYGNDDREHS